MMPSRLPRRTVLAALLALAWATPVLGANLTRVEVSSAITAPGRPVQVTVHKAGGENCGFQVLPGDGARLGPFGLPGASKTVPHTFSTPGTYQLRAVGARHGAKPACGGRPAAITIEVAAPRRLAEESRPPPQLRSVTPAPAIVGQAVTIQGSGFGSQSEMELSFGSYGDTRRRVLGAGQIRSWSDTRIVVVPPYAQAGTHFFRVAEIPPPLSPGAGLVASSAHEGFANFEVAMPRPTITGYRPANVCPGSTLEIQGRDFTGLRGGFEIIWNKVGGGGITMRDDRIRGWSDRAIQLQVPTDLPAYIAPGDRYRLDLVVREERGFRTMARGPEGRLADLCGPAATPRTPGRSPSIGTKHGLQFTLAPVNRRVAMGEQVVFGGTFKTSSVDLGTRLRSTPIKIAWRIVRDGEEMARGTVPVKGRSAPLLVRTKATKQGTYRLVLAPVTPPRDVSFRADLDEAWVRIVRMEQLQVPGRKIDIQQRKQKLPLPPPKGLEPTIRP